MHLWINRFMHEVIILSASKKATVFYSDAIFREKNVSGWLSGKRVCLSHEKL